MRGSGDTANASKDIKVMTPTPDQCEEVEETKLVHRR